MSLTDQVREISIKSPEALEVLSAMLESSADNGDDFGFLEDVREFGAAREMNAQALGAHITNLVKSLGIVVHESVRTDSGLWTQFTFGEDEEEGGKFDRADEIRAAVAVAKKTFAQPSDKTIPHAYSVEVRDPDGNLLTTFSVEINDSRSAGKMKNQFGESFGAEGDESRSLELGEAIVEVIEANASAL